MSGVLLWVASPQENVSSLLSFLPRNGTKKRSKLLSKLCLPSGVLAYSGVVASPSRSSEEIVYDVVLKQAALVKEKRRYKQRSSELQKPIETDGMIDWDILNEAYDRCGEVCAEYAKTFYLGTCSFTSILSLSIVLGGSCFFFSYPVSVISTNACMNSGSHLMLIW